MILPFASSSFLAIFVATSVVTSIGSWGVGVGARWNVPTSPEHRPNSKKSSSIPFLLLLIAVLVCCLFCLKIICSRCGRERDEDVEEQQQRQDRDVHEIEEPSRQRQQQRAGSTAIPSLSGDVAIADAEAINLALNQRRDFIAGSRDFPVSAYSAIHAPCLTSLMPDGRFSPEDFYPPFPPSYEEAIAENHANASFDNYAFIPTEGFAVYGPGMAPRRFDANLTTDAGGIGSGVFSISGLSSMRNVENGVVGPNVSNDASIAETNSVSVTTTPTTNATSTSSSVLTTSSSAQEAVPLLSNPQTTLLRNSIDDVASQDPSTPSESRSLSALFNNVVASDSGSGKRSVDGVNKAVEEGKAVDENESGYRTRSVSDISRADDQRWKNAGGDHDDSMKDEDGKEEAANKVRGERMLQGGNVETSSGNAEEESESVCGDGRVAEERNTEREEMGHGSAANPEGDEATEIPF